MNKYFDKFSQKEVDLDNTKLFRKWKPYNRMKFWGEFHLACIEQLGYALVYMKYLRPDMYYSTQKRRVLKLCRELRDNENTGDFNNGAAGRNPDIKFWRGFLYRILDEIENMC